MVPWPEVNTGRAWAPRPAGRTLVIGWTRDLQRAEEGTGHLRWRLGVGAFAE